MSATKKQQQVQQNSKSFPFAHARVPVRLPPQRGVCRWRNRKMLFHWNWYWQWKRERTGLIVCERVSVHTSVYLSAWEYILYMWRVCSSWVWSRMSARCVDVCVRPPAFLHFILCGEQEPSGFEIRRMLLGCGHWQIIHNCAKNVYLLA